MTRKSLGLVATAGLITLLAYWGPPASAQTAPSLGSAESFAVLGGSAVTVAATGTVITGDVGVSPGTSITGIPGGGAVVPPFTTHANDASAIAAQTSTGSLYTTLAGTGGATAIGAELGGTSLGPGTYSFTSTANIAAGTTLTLTGAGTYIFKVGSAITANVGSTVLLLNGASACNVFWQVTSAATLNGASFPGTVVAQAGVTLGVGAALTGRALTTPLGAVTMSGANTVGGCSTAAAPPPVCPVITLSPSTLPSGTAGVAYSQTIAGSGGTAPYSFAVTTGSLPAGLTLTAAGVLAGTPTTAGTSSFTIRGTDANGCFASTTYTIAIAAAPPPPPVCPAITLAPATLAGGTVGVAATLTLAGSGGTAPYTFGVTAGALPAGVTLSAAGVLAGTPTIAGTSSFTIRATDANGCSASVAYTIVIAAAPPPPAVCPAITLAPATLASGTVGVAATLTLAGSGGTAPYTFGVTAGALPAGVTLTAAGVLAGTPTVAGTNTFTIRVTDANGCFTSVAYTIVIAAAPLPPAVCPVITLLPATLPNGTVGVAATLTITGSGGTAPYTFGVAAGALPTGVTLSAAGVLAGTPTTAGTSTVTIRGTDANGCFASVAYTIVIAAAPLPPAVCPVITIPQTTLPNLAVGVAYSTTITASGGTAPNSFGVTAGALPAGITLTAAGVLAGTPTTAGTYTFTIRGTDANGCFAAVSYTIVIPAIPIPVPTLPQMFVVLLALGLTAVGYYRLRWQARTE